MEKVRIYPSPQSFNDAVRARIVAANSDVMNLVLLLELSQRLDKRGTVVGNDFGQSAPSTEQVLINPVADRLVRFASQHLPFWKVANRAAGLNNELIPTRHR